MFPLLFFGADGRTWTGTDIAARGILSPLRLPISPHRHIMEATLRIELRVRVLQTRALPLGYVAIFFVK